MRNASVLHSLRSNTVKCNAVGTHQFTGLQNLGAVSGNVRPLDESSLLSCHVRSEL